MQILGNTKAITTTHCTSCNVIITLDDWEYRRRLKNERGIFCSPKCALIGRRCDLETKTKISNSQKGISVLSRGRKGHIVTEETKEKIRQSRLGTSSIKDNNIIIEDIISRKVQKYALTEKLIPDAIYIENGKLVALEIEKKSCESDAKRKMQNYEKRNGYDKVIIAWYSKDKKKIKEWIKEKGKWKEYKFT